MPWPFVLLLGILIGVNLGVLLMVSMQTKRKDRSATETVLLARIQELETGQPVSMTPPTPLRREG